MSLPLSSCPSSSWSPISSSRCAIIVGAGVAGPAIGLGLHRVGIRAVVYEASPAPRDDEGAFLNLAPNGMAVLRALGVGYVMDGLGFRNDRLIFHNEVGRAIAEARVGGVTVSRGL